MPTYRNDGKNVLLVERSDGVVVPVGPGESVETFQTITVAGFTQTAATPALVETVQSSKGSTAVAHLVNVSWGEHEIQLPKENLTKHSYQSSFFRDGDPINWEAVTVYGKPPGVDSYIRIGAFTPANYFQSFEGIFTHLKFDPGPKPGSPVGEYTYTVHYAGWN